jgi:hypothetical protein
VSLLANLFEERRWIVIDTIGFSMVVEVNYVINEDVILDG